MSRGMESMCWPMDISSRSQAASTGSGPVLAWLVAYSDCPLSHIPFSVIPFIHRFCIFGSKLFNFTGSTVVTSLSVLVALVLLVVIDAIVLSGARGWWGAVCWVWYGVWGRCRAVS